MIAAITSCCRINLLEQMLNSFQNCCLDKNLITKYYIFDDHSPKNDLIKLKKKFPYIHIFHNKHEGQAYSLNFMHKVLESENIEWYLHLEDDWKFVKKSHFIKDMLKITELDDRIKNVVLRYWDCPKVYAKRMYYHVHAYKPDETTNSSNDWAWYGYSLNPGLQHIPTIKRLGRYDDTNANRNFDKCIARKYYELGYKRANLKYNYIVHTGSSNHSIYLKKTNKHVEKFQNNFHLIQLKDRHKGERCFIVGSGPSLKQLNLTKLKNEITFGSNQIYKYYKEGLPSVTYYHIGDHTCKPKIEADKKAGYDVDNLGQKFYRAGGFWVHLSYYPNANPYYVEDVQPIEGFKCDLAYPISHGNSITTESIAFAIYMGCNPIYIIGLDMTYKRGEPGFTSFDYNKAHQAHDQIKEYCKKFNISIYNSTPDGRLKAYKRIKYETLF